MYIFLDNAKIMSNLIHISALTYDNYGRLSCHAFFAYWTYFEHTSGQSIGKRLLKIKSTDGSGMGVDIKRAALESFGKSFLLPLDVILGWLFTNNKRQRIFNKISNTIVIKLKPREDLTENIRYRKD